MIQYSLKGVSKTFKQLAPTIPGLSDWVSIGFERLGETPRGTEEHSSSETKPVEGIV